MRILFLDQYGEIGGAQQVMLDLIPAVHAQGWKAFAAVPEAGPLRSRLESLGVGCSPLDCGSYTMGSKALGDGIRFAARFPGLWRAIAKLASRHGVDLLYVNGPRLLPPAAMAANGRLPLLFHCHNQLSGRAVVSLAGRSLQIADAFVVSSSHFTVEPLRRYVSSSMLRIVYNGTAGPSNRQSRARSGHWRIGVVGRIDANKGQDIFLKAARLLDRAGERIQLVICGAAMFSDRAAKTYEQSLRALAEGLDVEFTGYRDDAVEVIAGLDLLVVPSMIAEATTRVILEAFAHSTPVAAFSTGGIPEVIEDSVNGFLVHERTPEALADCIRNTLSHPHRLDQVSEAAYQSWRQRFSLERYQREMIEAIQAACRR